MPQSIMIGLLVLGGVLLLIAITGGNFKIFDAEVDSPVKSAPVRILSGVLGLLFIGGALLLNRPAGSAGGQAAGNNSASNSSSGAPAAAPNSAPSPGGSAGSSGSPSAQPAAAGAAASNPSVSNSSISSSEYAIVFDPPTNVRVGPSTGSDVQCSVTAKTTIRILGLEGNWYRTDVCGNGQTGYIYRNQVKF
jgi:hypothetical protein